MKKVIKELEKVEKIQICTSVQSYKEKPKGISIISNINFMQSLYNTPFDVYTELRRGYCYSHYFGNGESRYFTISEKKDENFNSTQMIVIDIDKNTDKSLKECIELLKNSGIKYNFILPSYSYTEETPKLHIYYIFDFMINEKYYKHITNKLNQIIVDCLDLEVDTRNLSLAQYFNSCHYLNENIKHLFENDLLFNSNDKITLEEVIKLFGSEENFYNLSQSITNIRGTKAQRKKAKHNTQSTENQRKEQLKEELLLNADYQILKNDISRLDFEEVQELYGTEYKWIYKTTKSEWIEFKSKEYGKIYYQLKDMDNFINLSYNKKQIVNGEMRRNKLHNRAVCRRMIYFDYMNETQQDIPFDVLFYNCYLDMHYIIDNSDKKDMINYNEIENICLDVMKYDIQELKEKFDTLFQNTKNNSSKAPFIIQGCKNGVKARKLMSEIKSMYIKKLYKSTLSYSENIKLLPFNISLPQYKRIIKSATSKKECPKVSQTYNKNEIIGMYDFNLSIRNNIEVMRKKGIEISKSNLGRIIKEYKEAI